jgi:dTDP-glucose 4,6-dehydratase
MTTLFVTGGAGFIGTNFIRYWLSKYRNDRLINYDLLTYAGNLENLRDVEKAHRSRYKFVKGDLANQQLLNHIFAETKPDFVVNFAAESHNSRAVVDPGVFFRTNVLGTQSLLEAARSAGVPRVHHVSTCEVYGDLPLDSDESFSETSPYRPRTPYNASKACADLVVRAYADTFKLPVTISNCANNFGPYQFPEKVIPYFTIKGLNGEQMPLYESTDQKSAGQKRADHKREWLHVTDHCRAIELILSKGKVGETYNVGSGVELDIDEIADKIISVLKLDPSCKKYVSPRPQHDLRYLLDSTKIKTELGWSPSEDTDALLEETILWYRDNRSWWLPLLDKLTVDEGQWAAAKTAGADNTRDRR